MRKIIIGSDHAGFLMKEKVKKELGGEYEFVDVGTNSEESVDYPIYAEKVANQVAVTPDMTGVLLCGNGVGMTIVANKVHGVRCALAYSVETAKQGREHNNVNVLATAGRTSLKDNPVEIVRAFLETEFLGEERHDRRVKMITDIEKRN